MGCKGHILVSTHVLNFSLNTNLLSVLNLYLNCILGRIRNTPEPADELDDDSCVLSLGLFPGEALEVPGDDR